jgi:coat protein Gp5
MPDGNVFQFVDWIGFEMLRQLKNKLVCGKYANHDYEKGFKEDFAVGDTVRVPLPTRWIVTKGMGFQPQAITEMFTTISVNEPFNIHFQYDSVEEALKMGKGRAYFKRRYLDPMVTQLANYIDTRFINFATINSSNIVGQLGVDPTSMTPFMQARQRLIEQGTDPDAGGPWGMFHPPAVSTSLVPAYASYLNPTGEISEQYRSGEIASPHANAEWRESVNLTRVTAGTQTGTNTVNGANQQGSQLIITATAGDTYNAGDIFNIAATNAVNPLNRQVISPTLKQFVVTTPITCVGGGVDVLNISPPIFGPGSQFQNVDALPATGAAMTSYPGTTAPNGKTSTQGLLIAKDAFALVGVPLANPKACEWETRAEDPDTKMSIAMFKMMDPQTRSWIVRADVLMGFGALLPDNASCRIACA